MKVVVLHTDLRIYWPARLRALQAFLHSNGHVLDVIEFAGKGSNYSFAENGDLPPAYWHILFSNKTPEELSGKTIKKALFPMLSALKPDVLVAGAIAFPSGALAVAWGQKTKTPVIIFDDSKIEIVRRGVFVNAIKKVIYKGVDAMFYPAPEWVSTGKFWGFGESQMFFGVDVVDNHYWEQNNSKVHVEDNYFLAVGRQIPTKNFMTVVKAYHRYWQTIGGKAYKLYLVGDGPEHHAIVSYIAQCQIETDVICMPFLSQSELAGVYHNARALCLSSRQEPWGLVINEAMACGCPIIASVECGATSVLVHEGLNGYTFSCYDVHALTKCLVKFHRLTEEQQFAMKIASKQIVSDWGLERFCRGCEQAIRYVSSQPKHKVSLIERLIIQIWKGRYHPV